MAFRPHEYLIVGELDNRKPGKIEGWMRYLGHDGMMLLDLAGDFREDIRGLAMRFRGYASAHTDLQEARSAMACVSLLQTGRAGDITAGLPPAPYVDYPYIEWYSKQNGRVVLELDPEMVDAIWR